MAIGDYDFKQIQAGQSGDKVAIQLLDYFNQLASGVTSLQTEISTIKHQIGDGTVTNLSGGNMSIISAPSFITAQGSKASDQLFEIAVNVTYGGKTLKPGTDNGIDQYSYITSGTVLSKNDTSIVATFERDNDYSEFLQYDVVIKSGAKDNTQFEFSITFDNVTYRQIIPISFNEKGDSGEGAQGIYTSTVFKRNPEKAPDKPANDATYDGTNPCDYYHAVPVGWSDGIPTGTDPIWSTHRIFTSDGKYPQESSWNDVVLAMDNGDFDFCYCDWSGDTAPKEPTCHGTQTDVDQSGFKWHDVGNANDRWMAESIRNNGTWGAWSILKVKGESGKDGNWTYTIYKKSDELVDAPTIKHPYYFVDVTDPTKILDDNGNPIDVSDTTNQNWVSIINDSEATWWESSAIIDGSTGLAQKWSTPICTNASGSDGISVYTSTVFKRQAEKPTTPTSDAKDASGHICDFSHPIPDGWSDGIPTAQGNANPLWETHRRFSYPEDEKYQDAAWSEVRLAADHADFDCCFCDYDGTGSPTEPILADGSPCHYTQTGRDASGYHWHDDGDSGDTWMATSYYSSASSGWSKWQISKVVGEDGSDGQYVQRQWAKFTTDIYNDTMSADTFWSATSSALGIREEGEYIWIRERSVIPAHKDKTTKEEIATTYGSWDYTCLTGQKGDKGTSLTISGVIETYGELFGLGDLCTDEGITHIEQIPAPADGTCYSCQGHLWVWQESVTAKKYRTEEIQTFYDMYKTYNYQMKWVDCGKIQGEKGDNAYVHIKYADTATFVSGNTYIVTELDWLTSNDGEDPGKFISIWTNNEEYQIITEKNISSLTFTMSQGEDGLGYEYIYTRTSGDTTILVPTILDVWVDKDDTTIIYNLTQEVDSNGNPVSYMDKKYQESDFVPNSYSYYNTDDGHKAITEYNWTDNPMGPTPELKYEWCCKRAKSEGVWAKFVGRADDNDKAFLYNRYGDDGLTVHLTNLNHVYKLVSETKSTIEQVSLDITASQGGVSQEVQKVQVYVDGGSQINITTQPTTAITGFSKIEYISKGTEIQVTNKDTLISTGKLNFIITVNGQDFPFVYSYTQVADGGEGTGFSITWSPDIIGATQTQIDGTVDTGDTYSLIMVYQNAEILPNTAYTVTVDTSESVWTDKISYNLTREGAEAWKFHITNFTKNGNHVTNGKAFFTVKIGDNEYPTACSWTVTWLKDWSVYVTSSITLTVEDEISGNTAQIKLLSDEIHGSVRSDINKCQTDIIQNATAIQTLAKDSSGNYSEIKQTVSSISLSVNNIESGLTKTGIDIENHKVTVTSDNFVVRNNSGQETVLIDSNGKITTKLIDAEGITAKEIHVTGTTGSVDIDGSTGNLSATSVYLKGTIDAEAGNIGYMEIQGYGLTNENFNNDAYIILRHDQKDSSGSYVDLGSTFVGIGGNVLSATVGATATCRLENKKADLIYKNYSLLMSGGAVGGLAYGAQIISSDATISKSTPVAIVIKECTVTLPQMEPWDDGHMVRIIALAKVTVKANSTNYTVDYSGNRTAITSYVIKSSNIAASSYSNEMAYGNVDEYFWVRDIQSTFNGATYKGAWCFMTLSL